MHQSTTRDFLAVSMHVVAASAMVAIQTQERMQQLTDSILRSVALCKQIAAKQLADNETRLQVIEEKEELKDSSTKPYPQDETSDENPIVNFEPPCTPQKLSLLSQQLSQIKVDREQEAREQEALLKLVEQVDPEALIPKVQTIEVFDSRAQQSIKKEAFVFENQEIAIIEASPNNKSGWSNSSPVQYQATSYNTNESSNLDHHSFRWDSDDQEDNLFDLCMQSSVFDFPFPQGFQEQQLTPKKKRLYCNNKKVPHWAEDMQRIQKKQVEQRSLKPEHIFGRMGDRVQEIAKIFTDKKQPRRGSSARWDISLLKYDKVQREFQELKNLNEASAKLVRQQRLESQQKQMSFFQKTSSFIQNISDKLFSSKKKHN